MRRGAPKTAVWFSGARFRVTYTTPHPFVVIPMPNNRPVDHLAHVATLNSAGEARRRYLGNVVARGTNQYDRANNLGTIRSWVNAARRIPKERFLPG